MNNLLRVAAVAAAYLLATDSDSLGVERVKQFALSRPAP
jgi:hypothetical protein